MRNKIISLVLILFFTSCHEYNYCVGCSENYPYYNASHLQTKIESVASLPPISSAQLESLSKLKKVIVFPVKTKRKTVVGFADEFLTQLEHRGWKVLDSDTQIRNKNPLVDIERATGIAKPDIVAFYMTEMSESPVSQVFYTKWIGLTKSSFLKVAILEDFNFPWQVQNANYFCSHADLILVRYPEALEQLEPNCSKSVFSFPHVAGKNFVQSVDFDTKQSNLLLSGAVNLRWYPLRVQAQKLYQSGDPKIVLRKHPGYAVKMDPAQEQVDYAQEIARHKLGLTGAGMGLAQAAPYILAKHFEIAAAGSVVVTDTLVAPLMRRLGFIENVHYLATTPDTLESDLIHWLKPENKEHLNQIALAGQKLVLQHHTLEIRVSEFENAVYWAWHRKQ